MPSTRVYVGNLPMDVRTREVEDLFHKFGRIRDVELKFSSRPPAFAFVDFEDARDAARAIEARDGYDYDGQRLRVEPANPIKRDGRASTRNERGSGEFAVDVSRLPPRTSWQDLKDYMRKAGDVTYVSVDGRGGGYVEYSNRSDMKYALDKLDDVEMYNRGDRAYIRVKAARRASRSRSRSRSRSPRTSTKSRSRKRSRSRSPRSRSRSRSARRGRSRSRSASRSRSRSRSARKRSSKKSRRDHDNDKRSLSKSPSPRAHDSSETEEETKESSDESNGKSGEVAPSLGTDHPHAASPLDWTVLKEGELREYLSQRGLSTSGERAELVARLEASTNGTLADNSKNGEKEPDAEHQE